MSSAGSDSSSSSSSSITVVDHLLAEIRAGDLENLCALLLRQIGKRPAVTDHDIHKALYSVAETGSVGACRLLWERLSPRGKDKYFATDSNNYGILHAAVERGDFEIVRLFIHEFKWNINQKNIHAKTPLCYAEDHLETASYLLENGANVNLGGEFGPLWFAIFRDNTEVSRLLLVEYRANPNLNRRPSDEEIFWVQQQNLRCTDHAILHGNAEILHLLLEHGAFVGFLTATDVLYATSLNMMLCHHHHSLETKLSIARILVEHALEDHATAEFIEASFQFEVTQTTNDNNDVACRILIDAGIDPIVSMYCAIRADNLSIC